MTLSDIAKIFETFMLLAFGVSWPINILSALKARTARGQSLIFLVLIMLGYVFGVAAKIVANDITYVIFFYSLNLVLVIVDIGIFFRNKKLDKERRDRIEQNAKV